MFNQTLTDKQRKVLDFIVDEQAKGNTPSVEEIAAVLGYKRKSNAAPHLSALVKKGYIRRRKGLTRSIEVIDTGRAHTIYGSFPIGA